MGWNRRRDGRPWLSILRCGASRTARFRDGGGISMGSMASSVPSDKWRPINVFTTSRAHRSRKLPSARRAAPANCTAFRAITTVGSTRHAGAGWFIRKRVRTCSGTGRSSRPDAAGSNGSRRCLHWCGTRGMTAARTPGDNTHVPYTQPVRTPSPAYGLFAGELACSVCELFSSGAYRRRWRS